MSIQLESFQIQSPEFELELKVDLVEGLDTIHIDFIKNQWRPIFTQRRNLAMLQFFLLPIQKRTHEASIRKKEMYGVADYHWDWEKKCKFAGSKRQIFGLLHGNETEAAMIVHFENNSRIGNTTGNDRLAYVEYLAVAPWNRKEIQQPRRFAGLGRTLLGKAVRLSQAQGMNGRCGLHSLKSAESFYHQCGMTDLGVDVATYGLRYFEFDAQSALKFQTEDNS